MAAKIPNEILLDIFLRLDIQSLFRVQFACCKAWGNMIDADPCFVNTHLARTAKSSPLVPLLILDYLNPNFLAKPGLTRFHALKEDGDKDTFKTSFVAEVVMDSDLIFSGSCNGLLCLYSKSVVFICNPLLKQVITISRGTRTHTSSYIQHGLGFGFGFDFKSNTYKIVQVTCGGDCPYVNGVEVYTLGTKSWRKINEKPKHYMYLNRPVFAHGALHWNTEQRNNEIVSFDLAKEEFYATPCPHFKRDWVIELDGLLGIVHISNFYLEIWLFDGTEKWTIEYRIDLKGTVVPIYLVTVMGMWKDGEIWLKSGDIFFMYNRKNNKSRRVHVDLKTDYTRIIAFSVSLVSPKKFIQ